ncbi:MAG: LD-carboxypeptidase [Muribaculaceae bacterium]|nr:LD-carboxypeptidase [Muribaculaceae bacterium]
MSTKEIIMPAGVCRGDKVAIVSPASPVRGEFIDGAAEFLAGKGLEPVVFPHAKGPASGSYASDFRGRLDDLLAAYTMPEIKAVVCSRGGYGAVHLLPHIPGNLLRENPKWLVGFSDISALHALSVTQGVASVHGPMTKHFYPGSFGGEEVLDIIMGNGMTPMEVSSGADMPDNNPGTAEGRLIGGNVAVLDGLAATPFDLFGRALSEDSIIFIEDIAEPIYKIERILYRLLMQGVLSKSRGLVVGRFSEYKGDSNYSTMEKMISDFLRRNGLENLPAAYGFPIGHIEGNRPVIEGARVRLECDLRTARITELR